MRFQECEREPLADIESVVLCVSHIKLLLSITYKLRTDDCGINGGRKHITDGFPRVVLQRSE
jgi:hypothetical protein